MKIDKRLTSVKGSKPSASTQRTTARKIIGSHAATADKLQITASAGQLSELENQLGKHDVVSADKVKAVRLAINNGSFKVDSEVVADGLIGNTKELIRKRPRKT